MREFLIILFSIVTFLSCKEQTSETSKNQSDKADYSISNIYQYDTLTLFARYKEYGEWGGHTEIFKIYRNYRHEIWSDYKKDSVKCRGEITHKIIYEKTLKLTQENQESVIRHMHDLLNQNFMDKPLLSNAGEYYSVISSDSSLVISHYTNHYDGFDKLRDKITQ